MKMTIARKLARTTKGDRDPKVKGKGNELGLHWF